MPSSLARVNWPCKTCPPWAPNTNTFSPCKSCPGTSSEESRCSLPWSSPVWTSWCSWPLCWTVPRITWPTRVSPQYKWGIGVAQARPGWGKRWGSWIILSPVAWSIAPKGTEVTRNKWCVALVFVEHVGCTCWLYMLVVHVGVVHVGCTYMLVVLVVSLPIPIILCTFICKYMLGSL